MTGHEYQIWLNDLGVRFPSMPIRGDTARIQFDEIFAGLDAAAVREATKEVTRNPPDFAVFERLAPAVAKEAQRIAWERKQRTHPENPPPQSTADLLKAAGGGCAEAYNQAIAFAEQCRKDCDDCGKQLCQLHSDQRRELISRVIDEHTPSRHGFDEPRYSCLRCRDTGLAAAIDDEWRRYVAACSCAAGDVQGTKFQRFKRGMYRLRGERFSEFDEWNETDTETARTSDKED